MQTATFRIQTQAANSTSYNDNHCTNHASNMHIVPTSKSVSSFSVAVVIFYLSIFQNYKSEALNYFYAFNRKKQNKTKQKTIINRKSLFVNPPQMVKQFDVKLEILACILFGLRFSVTDSR